MAAERDIRCYRFDRCGHTRGADGGAVPSGCEAVDDGRLVGWICSECAGDPYLAGGFAAAMRRRHPRVEYYAWEHPGGEPRRVKVRLSWMR